MVTLCTEPGGFIPRAPLSLLVRDYGPEVASNNRLDLPVYRLTGTMNSGPWMTDASKPSSICHESIDLGLIIMPLGTTAIPD